jgi:hypothetical protein
MIGPQFLLTTMRIRPMRVRLQAQLLIPLARANRANRAQLHVASGLAVAVRLLAVAARVVGGFGAEGVDQDGEGGTAADDYGWVGGLVLLGDGCGDGEGREGKGMVGMVGIYRLSIRPCPRWPAM